MTVKNYHPQPYLRRGHACIGCGTDLEEHPEHIPYEDIRHKVKSGLLGGGRVSRSFEALWHDMEPKKGR